MMFRTQILTCHPDKRAQMSMALTKGGVEKPPGMLDMHFLEDDTDDNTLVILQKWESKEACMTFQASIPAEKQAFFADLVAAKMECWHQAPIRLLD